MKPYVNFFLSRLIKSLAFENNIQFKNLSKFRYYLFVFYLIRNDKEVL